MIQGIINVANESTQWSSHPQNPCKTSQVRQLTACNSRTQEAGRSWLVRLTRNQQVPVSMRGPTSIHKKLYINEECSTSHLCTHIHTSLYTCTHNTHVKAKEKELRAVAHL